MQKILIVEDEAVIRTALRRLLERHDYRVDEATSVQDAVANCNFEDYHLIVSDLRLPGAPGTELIGTAGRTPVLIMTSYASLRSAVDAMRLGAADYIAKPFDHNDMMAAVTRVIESRSHRQPAGPETPTVHGILGNCGPMQTLYSHIERVAPTDSTVLVLGETGTGKELVARSIHELSRRARNTLVSVNCAAIPDTLIESELFGYEKGAFTGANTSRMGLIEAADKGTLFLDEIGELPMEAQARLLRFIQEGEIRRIGSVHSRRVDVRLICATHRDLQYLASVGDFRQDLYYRINVLRLTLPPLRERGPDILELAEHFLEQHIQRLGCSRKHFSTEAIQAISNYAWPGNVRELEHAVERAVILTPDAVINADVLDIQGLPPVSLPTSRRRVLSVNGAEREPSSGDPSEDLSLEDYFQRFVLEHQDSMSETELAQKLGVSRKCLWERRQRLGIPRKKASTRTRRKTGATARSA